MRIPGWAFAAGMLVFVALTALCSAASFTVARQLAIDFPNQPTPIAFATRPATSTAAPTATHTPPPGVTFTPQPTPEATADAQSADPLDAIPVWNDPRRITILLMGIDQRSATNDPGPFRTDTMILVQIDPVRRAVGVLSIPRDLWVEIPGFQQGRITTANYQGDANALPGGGPALAMETVRANIGVRVDHFIRINFDVFTEVVDTIAPDGVHICIDQPIVDDHYPDAGFGTMTVRFEAGCQTLSAERLLQYARTRATQGGDFDRNQRQQQVLQALQDEVLNAGGILHFFTQIPALYSQLQDNFVTSLGLDDILSLARLVSEIPRQNITFGAIGPQHVTFETTGDGTQQVLIPRQAAIAQVVQETFNPPETDLTLAELRQRADSENATIVVFNNTTISGLAGQTRDWLNSRGVDVQGVDSMANPDSADTYIVDYTGNYWTTRYLAALLGIPADRIRPSSGDGLTSADVMIVAGPDIQSLLSGN